MTNLERLSDEELIELANDGLDANDLTVELAKRYEGALKDSKAMDELAESHTTYEEFDGENRAYFVAPNDWNRACAYSARIAYKGSHLYAQIAKRKNDEQTD